MRRYHSRFFGTALFLTFLAATSIASSGEGILTVKTDPDGIEVWLGDNFIGQSPVIEKKIKAGRYVLRLIDPTQHSSVTEDLFIKDGDTVVVDRAITFQFGRLKVSSTPEGADVLIASELGKTPLTNDFMNPGKYRIEIRSTSTRYQPVLVEATIPRGETVVIHQQLKKQRFWSKKNIISFILFAGTVSGFSWGIVEQGHYKMFKEKQKVFPGVPEYRNNANSAALNRVVGIIIGSTCAIGLGLIALF